MESTTRINLTPDPRPASEQPTEVRPTVAPGGREQCMNCGAPMAADQHYCTNCGERRGPARFEFMEGAGRRTRDTEAMAVRSRPRWNANTSLIAGVGTLLLALGIGVLIGRTGNNNSGSKAAPPVQVVSVAGGATGAAGAATPSTPTSSSSAAAAAAGAANAKVNHTSTKGIFTTKAPPPKVVTVGSPCSGAAKGCQGGKFTGNFFGG